MSQLLNTLAILACPIGMGAMMWVMARGRGRQPQAAQSPTPGPASTAADGAELARLRAEIDQLQAERRDADAGRLGEGQPKGLR